MFSSGNNSSNNNNNGSNNRPSPQQPRRSFLGDDMDVETSTQSDSDSDHDSTLTQPYLRFSSLLAGGPGRNRPSPSVAQQYAQLQLRRAAHRPYFSATSAGGNNSGNGNGAGGSGSGSSSRLSGRSSQITFGTLKKASMPSRQPSSAAKAKLTVLPAYLRHTSFLDHFQPEGVPSPSALPPNASWSTENESAKRRRLTDMHSYPFSHSQAHASQSHQYHSHQHTQHHHHHHHHHQHQHHAHLPPRRHHFRRLSDSSSGSSSGSSSSSGSDSGHSHSSAHSVVSAEERPPLKYLLPSRWSCTDKLDHMELGEDDLQVKYIGAGIEDKDAAAIRANRPIPPQCGIYYFEVYIKNKGRNGYIGVGVCNSTVDLARLPGWDPNSWGYHGDDGHSFGGSGRGKPYGPTFTTGDIVGCGVNFRDNTLFYTKNGVYLGVAFRDLKGPLYPTVGMRTQGEILETNFGQNEFVFNIVDHVKDERMESWRLLEESIQKGPPLHLDQSLANLVLSYMVHHGYSESAKQFSKDMQLAEKSSCETAEDSVVSNGASTAAVAAKSKHHHKKSSSLGSTNDTDSIAIEHRHLVEDTVKRKAIRHAILQGKIDQAIEMVQESYQGMLDTEEDVMLQLQCRKFIEMVHRASSHRHVLENTSLATSKGDRETNGDDAMDVDEPVGAQDKEKKDIKQKNKAKATLDDAVDGQVAEELSMLAEAIEFGQWLEQEYKDDRRPRVQRMLVDAFSVLAYSDPSAATAATKAGRTAGGGNKGTAKENMLSREGVANAVNLAILASQQLPTVAPLETIYRQTKMTLEELTRRGVGSAAFFDVHKDCL